MNVDIYFAFETSMWKDWERCEEGGGGGGREGMLLGNDTNVQKWFHMHGRGLGRPITVQIQENSPRLIRSEEHQSSPVTTSPTPAPHLSSLCLSYLRSTN